MIKQMSNDFLNLKKSQNVKLQHNTGVKKRLYAISGLLLKITKNVKFPAQYRSERETIY